MHPAIAHRGAHTKTCTGLADYRDVVTLGPTIRYNNSSLEYPSWMTVPEPQVLLTVVEPVRLRMVSEEQLLLLILLLQSPPQQVHYNDIHHQVTERKAVA